MKDKNGYEINVGDVLVCVFTDPRTDEIVLEYGCVEKVSETTDMLGNVVDEYVLVNVGIEVQIRNSKHLMFV